MSKRKKERITCSTLSKCSCYYCLHKPPQVISLFKTPTNFTPPHSKHRPPLGINNEQSLKTVSALINIPFKTTQKGTGTPVKNNIFIK